MRRGKKETKKSQEERLNDLIAERLQECATHLRHDLTDTDIHVCQNGLKGYSIERVNKAFDLCLRECEFMPRLADICKRLPEESPNANYDYVGLAEKVARAGHPFERWTEPMGGATIHYAGDRLGFKVVERITR